MNYSETLNYIHLLGNFSKPASLERITRLMESLGSPQDQIKSIHIAGTNGKGSTSAMLAQIFRLSGMKTGLFISPYVLDFRERIQINGNFISEQEIVNYSERIIHTGIDVTEFEFITAIAFSYFCEQRCDISIIETGLGGRLDATNVLKNPVASVITKIGLDHTSILGDTFEKIAKEKCGIIKNSNVICACNQEDSVLEVIKQYSNKAVMPDISQLEVLSCDDGGNAFIYKNEKYETSLCGGYQIENAMTVIEAINHSGYKIPYSVISSALKNVYFPARTEVISKNPLVVIDGAHNPDGAEALAEFLKRYSGKSTAIIGVMKDKNYHEVLKQTLVHMKCAVAVKVEGMERSLSAEALCDSAKEFCPCVTENNYHSAIRRASQLSAGEPVFVFGSLYLASGIREKLIAFYKNF